MPAMPMPMLFAHAHAQTGIRGTHANLYPLPPTPNLLYTLDKSRPLVNVSSPTLSLSLDLSFTLSHTVSVLHIPSPYPLVIPSPNKELYLCSPVHFLLLMDTPSSSWIRPQSPAQESPPGVLSTRPIPCASSPFQSIFLLYSLSSIQRHINGIDDTFRLNLLLLASGFDLWRKTIKQPL
ncbi:hypothetical protein SODALDRAFT_357886 [Sodiomyces alkalinus F11]|uniref:Uncharacterized protein n=1 Tax=Sodiomyces alkalinus (strain CBS 110278 / VKM F-3762 / F11) TaxID=1314773 RepID=A0A3N2PYC6_SODAK|nr:hypothetical protein SODALDRAFT_357886 [Sodiomyces alkalinus F11]ROT39482.1 hypothetical protein SODALDRAFT_357886 [Sodiomyces alkalinus F11]